MNRSAWVLYIGTYPPRECGIATFTQDLASTALKVAYFDSKIAAIDSIDTLSLEYSSEVLFRVRQNLESDYLKLAQLVNAILQIQCVNLQHEYGIFGGIDGSYILSFLRFLKKPVVTTLHTVLPDPSKHLKDVTQEIINRSQTVVVMTEHSKQLLLSLYAIASPKIVVIPHGIHAVSYLTPFAGKKKIGLESKFILSTFGLISRNKGIEYVLKAMPAIIKRYPQCRYLVAGQTHPVVKQQEGEAYRESLIKLVKKLKLENNVTFYDKYLELNDLFMFLQATDIYIAPTLDPDQTVSGTFSYALGAGRAIIATQFAQARELINGKNGILVDFRKPEEFEAALLRLLTHPKKLAMMHKNAYKQTRFMIWEAVATRYTEEFLMAAYSRKTFRLPFLDYQSQRLEPKLRHLLARLTIALVVALSAPSFK